MISFGKWLFYILTPIVLSQTLAANNLRQISNIENLSNNSIESLYQDKSGKLWIGTCDGLNVYNSKRIDVYQPHNKDLVLSGNIIDNIIETESGILWVQTYHGLNQLNRNTNTVKYYDEFKQRLFVAKDSKNILYVIQDDGFIQYYDSQLEIFKTLPFPGIIVNDLLSFTIDRDNKLWLFHSNGIIASFDISYTDQTISFKQKFQIESSNKLLYSFYSGNDVMLVDAEKQLYCMNLHNQSKEKIYNLKESIAERGEISSIINSNGSIFIGYKTNGVQILEKKEHQTQYQLVNIPINCGVFALLKDRYQDIVWIGTDGQGVYSYSNDLYTIRTTKIKDYIAQIGKPIRSIYKDHQNTLWVGTKGDGIIKFYDYSINSDLTNIKTEKLNTSNSALIDNTVYCMANSKKDILWIGGEYGLNYYSYPEGKIKKVDIKDSDHSIIYIHDIHEQDSVLWLASVGKGIIKARLKWNDNQPSIDKMDRITINNEDTGSNYFFNLYAESDSILWFANRGYGAYRVNTTTMKYESIRFSDKVNNKTLDEILSISKKDDCMFFGTSAGLIEYRSKNDFKILDNTRGLPNNTIHGIVKDERDNSLWLSTNKGIVNYNPAQQTLRNYGLSDGLGVIEFSDGAAYKDAETDVIYLGGVNGFVTIHKNRIYDNEYMPKLVFDGLSVYGKWMNINDYLTSKGEEQILRLKSSQNFITLEVNAIDFLNASNYTFMYKIDGISNQWIDNGNSNIISLTNLPHGSYKMYVKYVNRIVSKSSPEYILTLDILPPWYLSTFAKIIYFTLGLLTLILFIKYLDFRSQRKRRRIIKKLEAQHKEEVYESKLRFFTSIAHEFCTPLTLIYGPCNQILELESKNSPTKKYAQVILRNAQRLNSLIQDLIEFRKIETNNKPPFVEELDISKISNEVIASFMEFAVANKAKFYKTIPYQLKWNSDRNYITTILTNLLSNAFKYMSEEGSVEIVVKEEEENLVIRISNTGKGIKEQDLNKIFDRHLILDNLESKTSSKLWTRSGLGLAISDSMVKNLSGKIDVESAKNEWTHFIVTLPLLQPDPISTKQNLPTSDALLPLIYESIQSNETPLPQNTIDKTKQTILAIDDETDLLWLLSDIFADRYNVICIAEPQEVELTLNNFHPDIILCDINMPVISGIDLVSKIKSNKLTAHIPLIIVSAKQDVDEQIKGIDAGAELYITKPFNIEYLRSSVERLMQRKHTLKEYFSSPLSAFQLDQGSLVHTEDNRLINTIQQIIDSNISNDKLNADFIAQEMNISTRNLYRKMNGLTNKGISDMIRDSRLFVAESLLIHTRKTIDEIIYESGFSSRVTFYSAFSKKNQCTPTEYRNGMNK